MADTEKSSWITDHAFRPRLSPQVFKDGVILPINPYLCGHQYGPHEFCRMAEATHEQTTSLRPQVQWAIPSESAPTPDPPAAA